ncbi:dash complex, subunit dad1 [Grosmannia clavigera kw1407]|uniref:DASH complex subunit DAD1 n=1 Tax=Grosmannia clavigera (strain kw1407 / UAMH 11150) TaxID=655863 RepID=F0X6T6_GROCL|nr:dash complex, subunit dad1 [Grosmannia clavigera kw1407]EFX06360.1 dash complex, subunit dad1 [Grosmannia clavigera kw1407]
MSANSRAPSAMGARSAAAGKRSYFEQQREILVGEIAMSFEHVLANINKLNRSLEAVITVGNEFSSVEALWSQFEGVMAKEEDATDSAAAAVAADIGEDGSAEADYAHTELGGQEDEAGAAGWKGRR